MQWKISRVFCAEQFLGLKLITAVQRRFRAQFTTRNNLSRPVIYKWIKKIKNESSAALQISDRTIRRMLRVMIFHPYKIAIVQQLKADELNFAEFFWS